VGTAATTSHPVVRVQSSPRGGLCSTGARIGSETSQASDEEPSGWLMRACEPKPHRRGNRGAEAHVAMTDGGDEDPPSCRPRRSHRLRTRSPSGHTSRHRQPDTESSSAHPAFPDQPRGKAGWMFCSRHRWPLVVVGSLASSDGSARGRGRKRESRPALPGKAEHSRGNCPTFAHLAGYAPAWYLTGSCAEGGLNRAPETVRFGNR